MVNSVRIEQVIRLGRVQSEDQTVRQRPILVKLASKTEKWSVLKLQEN